MKKLSYRFYSDEMNIRSTMTVPVEKDLGSIVAMVTNDFEQLPNLLRKTLKIEIEIEVINDENT